MINLRRRTVAMFALGALASPHGLAQQGKVWRVGILSIRPRPLSLENDFQYGPFLTGLKELGYVEGKNLALEWRFAHGRYDLLPALAKELVDLKVDIITVVNTPVIRAAQQATKSIPIVMLTVSDPVGLGFVKSLARPGGNITGLSNINADFSAKYLELLTIVMPGLSRLAFLANSENPSHKKIYENVRDAAAKKNITTSVVQASNAQALDSAFADAASFGAKAIIVGVDSLFLDLRQRVVALTLQHHMASVYSHRFFVLAGGLMSYGQDFSENYRRAAGYVDKILRGAKPADLPVELATTLKLVVNRGTAKTLGLALPQSLLVRADEVLD